MLSNPEFRKLAETLTGRKLASDVVGASEPDPELLALGQEQLKKAFLDDATKQISDWWGRRAPDTQNALRGAGIGAGIGAATGLMTGRKRPFRDALLGGVLGGGLGGIAGGVGSAVAQKLKGDKEGDARDGVSVMNRASKIGRGTFERVEQYFPQVSSEDDPTTNTAVGWGGVGAGTGALIAAARPSKNVATTPRPPIFTGRTIMGNRTAGRGLDLTLATGRGLRAPVFSLPTLIGGTTGVIGGAVRESKQAIPGFSKDKISPEEFITNANKVNGILTDPGLKQLHVDILKRFQSGALPLNAAGDEMLQLYGQQKILDRAAGMAKGSSVLKQAGTWDDVKSWGSGMADKAQAYWTLGKGELEKNPKLQRGLYGAGIGAAAGGLLGATNRKRRGTSMLAGILGGGLLGAGGGMLSSRMGISGDTKDTKQPPKTGGPGDVTDAGAAVAPSGYSSGLLRNLGSATGTAAGVRYGPTAIRNLAEATRGITDQTGNEAAAYRARVTGELNQSTDNLNRMRDEMVSGNNTTQRYSRGSADPLTPREYTRIPEGYFDTKGRVETLRPQVDALDHEHDLYRRRPLLGNTNRLRAIGGTAGFLGGNLLGLTGQFSPPAAAQPQENK